MVKLLLLSCIIMTVVLPIRAARIGAPGRSLRRTVLSLLSFNLLYWVLVLFVYFYGVLGRDPHDLINMTVHD